MPLLNKIEIGKRLEAFRLELKLKPKEFAIKAKVDQSHYSKIEHGNLPLTDNVWDKLENEYNLNKAYILLGINVPRATFNSSFLEPGPQASLKQLLIAKRELALAAEKIEKRILDQLSEGKDNSPGENGMSRKKKDSQSNKGR